MLGGMVCRVKSRKVAIPIINVVYTDIATLIIPPYRINHSSRLGDCPRHAAFAERKTT